MLNGIFYYSTIKWSINRLARFRFILRTWWNNDWAEEDDSDFEEELEESEDENNFLENLGDRMALSLFMVDEIHFMYNV